MIKINCGLFCDIFTLPVLSSTIYDRNTVTIQDRISNEVHRGNRIQLKEKIKRISL